MRSNPLPTVLRRSTPFITIALTTAILLSATPAVRAAPSTASVSGPLSDTPSVTLAWAPPASNGGAVITGYRVYRGTAPGRASILAYLGVVSTFTDTAVTKGVTYYYQVTAVNLVGEGPRSAERAATPGAAATVPGAPFLNFAAVGDRSVALLWTAPGIRRRVPDHLVRRDRKPGRSHVRYVRRPRLHHRWADERHRTTRSP